ncbi:unnamed protein product [Medioppia subpectinata]|uniref:Fatty acid synthase n=1 Tax=Medioppia subpectinata TaxID=1979941 RepID=A0A7R9KQP1_9ACAR|nr:unnamed protein product [Medioppia subpectinata]CAG2108029.1 unnamed protein product [Medioppia subpectinata]
MNLSQLFADTDSDVVISGMSGRFPESDTMDELADNLYANRDLITADERRWPPGLYGEPQRFGKIKHIDKFDAQFFGVSGKQADGLDPRLRLLLEVVYEAIVDSGYNPNTLKGTDTAVFVGTLWDECQDAHTSDPTMVNRYACLGNKANMTANWVSLIFDLHGPSLAVQTACSSAATALQLATDGLRVGRYSRAIVAGANVCLKPLTSLELHRSGLLAPDGRCKFMDTAADGYVRGETVSALVLQRRKGARRVYATVIHALCNSDGYKLQGITYPSPSAQLSLIRATLREAGVQPQWVGYIEAHGTGTAVGDQNEVEAIYEAYCRGVNRDAPLLVGSVKTNLGHTEPSAGMCSLAKVVLAMEAGRVAASLHLQSPKETIPALMDGSVRPVTVNTALADCAIGVSSFGFGGTNVHILLRPNTGARVVTTSADCVANDVPIPRLIVATGRTEQAVDDVLDFVADHSADGRAGDDFLALLNAVVVDSGAGDGMDWRGFAIRDVTDDNGFALSDRSVAKVTAKPKLWFMCSDDVHQYIPALDRGVGGHYGRGRGRPDGTGVRFGRTQWTGMAQQMMCISIFRRSIEESAAIMAGEGVDLMALVCGSDDQILFGKNKNSSVAIAAVQIALVDLVRELGVEPDGYFGHSAGEMTCAYIDGAITRHQFLILCYRRNEESLPDGLMAAVGLTWAEVAARCPPGVWPACHNSAQSVTIAGTAAPVADFVAALQAEGVFVRPVHSCGKSFHCPLVGPVSGQLLATYRAVMPDRKPRSPKWISTSIGADDMDDGCVSAEYFVNNLLRPVLFKEALDRVPDGSVIVELAPDSLFRNIVKHSLPGARYIGLMKRNSPDSVRHFLQGIGELFAAGLSPRVQRLYPSVPYPVRRGTQSLSSLVRWDHTDSYLVPLYPDYFNHGSGGGDCKLEVDFKHADNRYYLDHAINGRALFPATGYLYAVWRELARQRSVPVEELPVVFENLRFHRPTFIAEDKGLSLKLIQSAKVGHEFRLYDRDNRLTVSGGVYTLDDEEGLTSGHFLPSRHRLRARPAAGADDCHLLLDKSGVYRELHIRGYEYGPAFQRTVAVDLATNWADIEMSGHNWVTFADAMLQTLVINNTNRDLMLPTHIGSVHCDPRVLFKDTQPDGQVVRQVYTSGDCIFTNGLEIYGLGLTRAPSSGHLSEELSLGKCVFVPYFQPMAAIDVNLDLLVDSYADYLNNVVNTSADTTAAMDRLRDLLAINELSDDILVAKQMIIDGVDDHKKLSSDLLNNIYLSEYLLRPAIDLILENNHSFGKQVFKVLEINFGEEVCHKPVMDYLTNNPFGDLNVDYSVYNPANDDNTEDTKPYNKVTINWSDETIASKSKHLDLIVVRDDYPLQDNRVDIDYHRVFDYIQSNIAANGFVLFFWRNDYTLPEKSLFQKFGVKYQPKDSLPLISTATASGLTLVSHRTYPKTCSSVLLWRKVETIIGLNHKIIAINDSADDQWFEELKAELRDNNCDHRTTDPKSLIWLMCNHPTNGIIGVVNDLRKETGGNRISYFCNETTPSANESVYDNQLVMNIKRSDSEGWGSYRRLSLNTDRLTTSPAKHAMVLAPKLTDKSLTVKWVEAIHNSWPQQEVNNNDNNNNNAIIIKVCYAGLTAHDLKPGAGRTSRPSVRSRHPSGLCSQFAGVDDCGHRYIGCKADASLSTSVAVNSIDDLIPIPDDWPLAGACAVPVPYGLAYLALVVNARLDSEQTVVIQYGSGYVGRAALAICLSIGADVYTTVDSIADKQSLVANFARMDPSKVIVVSEECDNTSAIDWMSGGQGVDIVFNYANTSSVELSLNCLRPNGTYISVTGGGDRTVNNALITSRKNVSIIRVNFDQLFGKTPDESTKRRVFGLIRDGIAGNVVHPFGNTEVFPLAAINAAFQRLTSCGHNGNVVIKVSDAENVDSLTTPVPALHYTTFAANRSYVVVGGLRGFGLEFVQWLVYRGAKHLALTTGTDGKTSYQAYCLRRMESIGAQIVVSGLNPAIEAECRQLVADATVRAPVGGIFCLPNPESKTDATVQHMDSVSRELCPQLRYFMAFLAADREISSERLCERRRADSLPALAIQWSVADDLKRIRSCLDVLNHFLRVTDETVLSVELRRPEPMETAADGQGLVGTAPAGDDRDVVSVIAAILGVKDVSKMNASSKLPDLGMDSLMVVTVKQALEDRFSVSLELKQLQTLTIDEIVAIVR